MLQNFCVIKVMYYYRHIKKSVSFSGSLWLREVGLPVFQVSFQFLFGQKMMAWKRISAQEVACFHSKKHKNHHHIVYVQLWGTQFRSALKNGWAKIIRAIFHTNHDPL